MVYVHSRCYFPQRRVISRGEQLGVGGTAAGRYSSCWERAAGSHLTGVVTASPSTLVTAQRRSHHSLRHTAVAHAAASCTSTATPVSIGLLR